MPELRPGEPWGAPGVLPPDGVVVHDDAELSCLLDEARRANRAFPVVGLAGGDLCRTLGGSGDETRLRSGPATTAVIDVAEALVDGVFHHVAAHLVARRGPWLTGRALLVMNAEFLGAWDVAPRSHPGDGRLDVIEADVGPGEVWKVRSRLRSGTHLPHPGIVTRRTKATQHHFVRRPTVWIDGRRIGSCSDLSVRVEPDVLRVVV